MQDINLIGAVRSYLQPTLKTFHPVSALANALRRPPVRRALGGLVLVLATVRVLNLDTDYVDLGYFEALNSDVAPASYPDPTRTLDTEISRHPFKRRFVVMWGFTASPESSQEIWTYSRYTGRLADASVNNGSGAVYTNVYSHVTDSAIHAFAKRTHGSSWEDYGVSRGPVIRTGQQ